MSIRGLGVIAAVLLFSACSSNRYCLSAQEYQGAADLPALQSAEGLKLPESPAALRIPPESPNAAPFGVRDEQGNGICLDQPPVLRLPADRPPRKKG
ncbi:MAG: hypothetical protein ACPGZP_05835 [Panacagrimonas sp.]